MDTPSPDKRSRRATFAAQPSEADFTVDDSDDEDFYLDDEADYAKIEAFALDDIVPDERPATADTTNGGNSNASSTNPEEDAFELFDAVRSRLKSNAGHKNAVSAGGRSISLSRSARSGSVGRQRLKSVVGRVTAAIVLSSAASKSASDFDHHHASKFLEHIQRVSDNVEKVARELPRLTVQCVKSPGTVSEVATSNGYEVLTQLVEKHATNTAIVDAACATMLLMVSRFRPGEGIVARIVNLERYLPSIIDLICEVACYHVDLVAPTTPAETDLSFSADSAVLRKIVDRSIAACRTNERSVRSVVRLCDRVVRIENDPIPATQLELWRVLTAVISREKLCMEPVDRRCEVAVCLERFVENSTLCDMPADLVPSETLAAAALDFMQDDDPDMASSGASIIARLLQQPPRVDTSAVVNTFLSSFATTKTFTGLIRNWPVHSDGEQGALRLLLGRAGATGKLPDESRDALVAGMDDVVNRAVSVGDSEQQLWLTTAADIATAAGAPTQSEVAMFRKCCGAPTVPVDVRTEAIRLVQNTALAVGWAKMASRSGALIGDVLVDCLQQDDESDSDGRVARAAAAAVKTFVCRGKAVIEAVVVAASPRLVARIVTAACDMPTARTVCLEAAAVAAAADPTAFAPDAETLSRVARLLHDGVDSADATACVALAKHGAVSDLVAAHIVPAALRALSGPAARGAGSDIIAFLGAFTLDPAWITELQSTHAASRCLLFAAAEADALSLDAEARVALIAARATTNTGTLRGNPLAVDVANRALLSGVLIPTEHEAVDALLQQLQSDGAPVSRHPSFGASTSANSAADANHVLTKKQLREAEHKNKLLALQLNEAEQRAAATRAALLTYQVTAHDALRNVTDTAGLSVTARTARDDEQQRVLTTQVAQLQRDLAERDRVLDATKRTLAAAERDRDALQQAHREDEQRSKRQAKAARDKDARSVRAMASSERSEDRQAALRAEADAARLRRDVAEQKDRVAALQSELSDTRRQLREASHNASDGSPQRQAEPTAAAPMTRDEFVEELRLLQKQLAQGDKQSLAFLAHDAVSQRVLLEQDRVLIDREVAAATARVNTMQKKYEDLLVEHADLATRAESFDDLQTEYNGLKARYEETLRHMRREALELGHDEAATKAMQRLSLALSRVTDLEKEIKGLHAQQASLKLAVIEARRKAALTVTLHTTGTETLPFAKAKAARLERDVIRARERTREIEQEAAAYKARCEAELFAEADKLEQRVADAQMHRDDARERARHDASEVQTLRAELQRRDRIIARMRGGASGAVAAATPHPDTTASDSVAHASGAPAASLRRAPPRPSSAHATSSASRRDAPALGYNAEADPHLAGFFARPSNAPVEARKRALRRLGR